MMSINMSPLSVLASSHTTLCVFSEINMCRWNISPKWSHSKSSVSELTFYFFSSLTCSQIAPRWRFYWHLVADRRWRIRLPLGVSPLPTPWLQETQYQTSFVWIDLRICLQTRKRRWTCSSRNFIGAFQIVCRDCSGSIWPSTLGVWIGNLLSTFSIGFTELWNERRDLHCLECIECIEAVFPASTRRDGVSAGPKEALCGSPVFGLFRYVELYRKTNLHRERESAVCFPLKCKNAIYRKSDVKLGYNKLVSGLKRSQLCQ